MSDKIDITILELLSSKVCHDLISPIGAVCNGIEFMSEMGADAGDEALSLIAYSAQQASAKLQAYRMAYGAGGSDNSIKPEDVYKSIEAIVSPDGKVKQVWDAYGEMGHGDEERPDAFSKILISVLLLGIDFLPKGGELDVKSETNGELNVIASGENAGAREQVKEALALAMSTDQITPKLIHAYILGLLSDKYGFKVAFTQDTDRVTITINLPQSI